MLQYLIERLNNLDSKLKIKNNQKNYNLILKILVLYYYLNKKSYEMFIFMVNYLYMFNIINPYI